MEGNENKYLTVSALNKYISYKFDKDIHLQSVVVKAEISNLRLSKGILYFVLKDDESEIDALMFSNNVNRLNFKPVDGMTVIVTGKINVYIKKGRYSITISTMDDVGLGEAYLNFIRLKEKLDTEGLFDQDKKLKLPRMAEKIGVITSSTGDALHDIVSTISKRFPIAEVFLYPAIVQGKDAPKSLINALNKAYKDNKVELIIIGRGGGSIEDLSCFNDEELARVIFDSKIPIISAVGHEADYTICDFVASFRAPTPTGAAVIATREVNDILNEILSYQKNLVSSIKQKLVNSYNTYQNLLNSYGIKNFPQIINSKEENYLKVVNHLHLVSPIQLINNQIKEVEDFKRRLFALNLDLKISKSIDEINNLKNNIFKNTSDLISKNDIYVDSLIDKLILLNPLNIMKKGYNLTYQENKLVTSIKDVQKDKNITIKYHDGKVKALVLEVSDEELS
ncbi:MAG: exodeoxyribonuclease VII large subunit [Bacilli bacterium]